MASLTETKNGYKRILFYMNKERKAIHLGDIPRKDANAIKARVESLLLAKILGKAIDQDDATWLAKSQEIQEKLAAVGLIGEVKQAKRLEETVAEHIADFISRVGAHRKPGTVAVWKQVEREVNREFPKGIRLKDVTKGHAKAFHDQLKKRGLASLTVVKHVRIAKQMFEDAVEWEKIPQNPFAKIKASASIPKNNVEVTRETIDTLFEHIDTTWKTIVGLSRYGGLRCPSETLSLKWSDVDFEKGLLHIPVPKLEHHEGRAVRQCPLFPELREILEKLFNEITEKQGYYPKPETYVIDKQSYRDAANTGEGWKNANLRTQFLKQLKKANITPWARLFHSMRASRQTELERLFPIHVVCSWLGNSPKVAARSYLLVTEDDLHRACNEKTDVFRETKPTRADAVRGTKPTLKESEIRRTVRNFTNENKGENAKTPKNIGKSQRMGRDSNPR